MSDNQRIEDLRRRVQKDPASIAFAQLGEELRRAGRSQEAIETCRAGLEHHPAYVSARVTLGRALLEIGQNEQAEQELKEVLRFAPENLAALRGVAEALQRRGDIAAALAPRDAELQQTAAALREQAAAVARPQASAPSDAPSTTPPRGSASSFNEIPPMIAQADALEPSSDTAGDALPALERWLDAIVADREQRSAGHQS